MDFIISPRLSFSNDLENDKTTASNNYSLADSTSDFAFNVESTPSLQSLTADELFCNGKIICTGSKKEEEEPVKMVPPRVMACLDQSSPKTTPGEKNKRLKEFLEDSIEEGEDYPNTTLKSFWKFRRSNSFNSDTSHRKGLLIESWKILSRSGSTGKFLEKIVEDDDGRTSRKPFWKFRRNNSLNFDMMLKRSDSTHDKCQNFDHIPKVKPFRRSSSLNGDTCKGIIRDLVSSTDKALPRSYSSGSASQTRQVKSNVRWYGYGNYNGNVKVSSMLNLPSPYISRVSVDLFGFSMFCNGIGKDKKKKK